MKVLDIQRLLKRFHVIVYTGDREGDLLVMEEEIKDLYEGGLIEQTTYLQARATLAQERQELGRSLMNDVDQRGDEQGQ